MKYLIPLLVVLAACGGEREMPSTVSRVAPAAAAIVSEFEEIAVPSADGAGQPYLSTSGAEFLLSWTEPAGEAHALRMARFDGESWSEPSTIAERTDFFVNWADFPSILESGDAVFAHWLQRSAPGTYDYDVMVAVSQDGGLTWGEPRVAHNDGARAEHGFASFLALTDSRAGLTWLDGRAMAGGHDDGHGDMSLRYAEISSDGTIAEEALLDPRTCECCGTTIVATLEGPLVAYRDRSETEVRDIMITRRVNAVWTEPVAVHQDGWEIAGCPVNGPQADVAGDRIAIAWFTGANDSRSVKVAFSENGGTSFGSPIEVGSDEGDVGYVDVVFVDDDRVLVIWMRDNEEELNVMAREVLVSGEMLDGVSVTTTTRGRTGFPRIARQGDALLLAWNEKGDTPRIHVARATITK